jgi:hypothetical protein
MPSAPRTKLIISESINLDYSQSLQKTKDKSTQLMNIRGFTKKIEQNKHMRLKNVSEYRKKQPITRP